ncbi:hypothetical protein J6590_050058 [Homalodisca vitripennis]|nr:hypothetical protein J6590_050058 [Homalodisca vitripennis]
MAMNYLVSRKLNWTDTLRVSILSTACRTALMARNSFLHYIAIFDNKTTFLCKLGTAGTSNWQRGPYGAMTSEVVAVGGGRRVEGGSINGHPPPYVTTQNNFLIPSRSSRIDLLRHIMPRSPLHHRPQPPLRKLESTSS